MAPVPHYPLNGIDMDFSRYDHRPLGPRDIIVNRIMEDYMSPRLVTPGAYRTIFWTHASLEQLRDHEPKLRLDMSLLERLLDTQFNWVSPVRGMSPSDQILHFMWPTKDRTLDSVVVGFVERHYLESDAGTRIWMKQFKHIHPKKKVKWKKGMVEHAKAYQAFSETHYRYLLYSGGHLIPIDPPSYFRLPLYPVFFGMTWFMMANLLLWRRGSVMSPRLRINPLVTTEWLGRKRPPRSSSVPSPKAWTAVEIEGNLPGEEWFVYFPRRRISELDKLSRRRSLSRTHIRAMFTDGPKPVPDGSGRASASAKAKHACANCAEITHQTSDCPFPCGYCKSSSHKSRNCKIKANNRCKCRPFPQFHTAFECFVRCSRRCGAAHIPGHFKHKTAMLCSHRCCMCGVRGHCGRQCSLKKCPCGGQHLTQDCRWKVECPAKNCDLYYCHLHCRECGKKKDKQSKDGFVGRTCPECLKNGQPVLRRREAIHSTAEGE
ncbi:hypothetical protein GGS23DRAFT_121585 [Durotheca rogersii]|uniref:uncharacterized protein n=1 Tax=Durotheca rogersii TaxID=419775 RepID=UPI00221F622B|nr:uncharacterized protein GGS23DRAFT_121585 [Durotheca rogersii]KAI5861983.1 hypothetical protein GGS23DRAFT_121585 [Durotheca rogersii]